MSIYQLGWPDCWRIFLITSVAHLGARLTLYKAAQKKKNFLKLRWLDANKALECWESGRSYFLNSVGTDKLIFNLFVLQQEINRLFLPNKYTKESFYTMDWRNNLSSIDLDYMLVGDIFTEAKLEEESPLAFIH